MFPRIRPLPSKLLNLSLCGNTALLSQEINNFGLKATARELGLGFPCSCGDERMVMDVSGAPRTNKCCRRMIFRLIGYPNNQDVIPADR